MIQRYDIINFLTEKFLRPRYLEIGSFRRENFNKVKAAVKHDVEPHPIGFMPTFCVTSDEFFKLHRFDLSKIPVHQRQYDVVFIDGLHLSEQVIKDVYYASQLLSKNGFIVLHDCLPEKEVHQARTQQDDKWMGDVWKAQAFFVSRFRDRVCTIEDSDCGCGIISGSLNYEFTVGMIVTTAMDLSQYKWESFVTNKKELLSLVSWEDFKRAHSSIG